MDTRIGKPCIEFRKNSTMEKEANFVIKLRKIYGTFWRLTLDNGNQNLGYDKVR